MKFSIKAFFSKCDQIHRKLRIWSHLLKKVLMANFIFCAVYIAWHPDPFSQGTDAMIQNWNIGLPYAFPLFSMISRVLLKIKQECIPLLILIESV